MKNIPLTTLLIIAFVYSSFSQNYTQVNKVVVQQNNYRFSNNAGLYSVAGSINSFRNAWEDEKKRNREIEKAKAQLNIVKSLFSEQSSFPKTIVDGWHMVKVTDNFNYCSDAKVFVENNEIKQLVINDYAALSLQFSTITGIKNAKSTVNLHPSKNTTDTAEIYFMYDLERPTTTSEPLEAGYITFWSDLGNAKTIEVWIDRDKQGGIEKEMDDASCFADGALTLQLKPGTYNFKAESRGSKSWRGTFEIKENECFTYSLNKKNTD